VRSVGGIICPIAGARLALAVVARVVGASWSHVPVASAVAAHGMLQENFGSAIIACRNPLPEANAIVTLNRVTAGE